MEIIDNYHSLNKDRIDDEIRILDLKDAGFYSVFYITRSIVYNDFKKNTISSIIDTNKISYDDAVKIYNELYISFDEYVYYSNNRYD